MSKEILRDKNGRFAKKSQEGIGISEEEYIHSLVNRKAELLRRNTELAHELAKIRAELVRVTEERDEARREVDRRNMRVHQLQRDKDVLIKLCLELYNCSSWWKRILHRKKIHALMMEVYNHTSDVYLFSIAQRITFIDELFSGKCEG